jgi:transcription factor TGA
VLSPAAVGTKMARSPDHHHHHQQQAAAAMEELATGSRRQDHHHLQHQPFAAEPAGINRDVKPVTAKKDHRRGVSTGERDPKVLY